MQGHWSCVCLSLCFLCDVFVFVLSFPKSGTTWLGKGSGFVFVFVLASVFVYVVFVFVFFSIFPLIVATSGSEFCTDTVFMFVIYCVLS